MVTLVRLCLISALALVLSAQRSYAAKPNDSTKAEAALIQWLKKTGKGFASKVRIGVNEDGVRGMFATQDIPEGEPIISIPPEAIINIGGWFHEDTTTEPAARVLRELKDPHTRFRPYLDAMPKPNELLCMCNIPEEYACMIPAGYWRRQYDDTLATLKTYLKGEIKDDQMVLLSELMGDDASKVTLDDLRYACALTTTRSVNNNPRRNLLLIPLFDMANHIDDCPVYLTSDLREGDQLKHLAAHRDIKKGEEICYRYTDKRDDHFLFHYGFLPQPASEGAFELLDIDTHGDSVDGHPEPRGQYFEGKADEVAAEIRRLAARLEEVDAYAAANPNPKPLKGHEYAHAQLVELQTRRRAAITLEIGRLSKVLRGQSEKHLLLSEQAAQVAAGTGKLTAEESSEEENQNHDEL